MSRSAPKSFRATARTALFVLLASAAVSRGASVTLNPVADTSLFRLNGGNNNFGGSTTMVVGTTAHADPSRALIQFDVAGSLPSGASVTSAQLRLVVTKAGFGPGSTFELHRVEQSWGEGSKGGLVGEAATANEATWFSRFVPSTSWSAPGAAAPTDFRSAVSGTQFVGGAGSYSFGSSANMVSDVQSWLDNPAANFGWIVISQSEGTIATARRIGSRESGAASPVLTVEFTLPGPVTHTLTVSKMGTGGGTVTSSLPGIDCGATCLADFAANSTVTLTATPQTGSVFAGWSGAGSGAGDTRTVTMDTAHSVNATFNIANIPPSANSQSLTISEDTGVAITLSGSDPEGSSLTYSIVTMPATGTLSGTPPNVTYMPNLDFNGSDSFTFKVNDGTVDSAVANISITITPVNDPPTISHITNQITNEDTPTPALALTIGDVDSPIENLVLAANSSNTNLVSANGIVFAGSGTSRTVTILPATNQFGAVTITLTVSDGSSTISDSFLLTVNAVNDPPAISHIADQITDEDTPTPTLAFTIGDVDSAIESLVLTVGSSNTNLVPQSGIVLGGSGANRTLTLLPATNQFGAVTITLTVSDGLLSASDSFVLTVNPVNDLPTISAIPNQTVAEGGSTGPIQFRVADVETSAESLSLSGTSSNTNLVPNPNIVFGGSGSNRTATITSASRQSGTSTITITVTDGGGDSASTSFILAVTACQGIPTIAIIPNQTIDEDTSTGAIAFRIDSPCGSPNDLILSSQSSNTNLVANTNIVFGGNGTDRTAIITPATNRFGNATIIITLSDTNGASASTSFLLTVNTLNDPPTISHIADQTIAEDTPTAALAFTISDVETPIANLTVTASSSNTDLVPVSNIVFAGESTNRTVTILPATNQFGTATITLTVSDGSLSASDSFVLAVNAVNDPPTISQVANQFMCVDDRGTSAAFSVSDVETPAEALSLSGKSSNPALVPDSNITFGGSGTNRTVTISALPNMQGTASITVTARDAEGLTSTNSFVLVVGACRGAPVITLIPDQTTSVNTPTDAIAFQVADNVTPATNLIVSAISSNKILAPDVNIHLSGVGADRTLTVVPATNQFGSTLITVTVADESGNITISSFNLAVTPANAPPRFASMARQPDGGFQLSVSGEAGRSYVLEASTNLVNWTAISTNAPTTNLFNFLDAAATNFVQRFYRVRQ